MQFIKDYFQTPVLSPTDFRGEAGLAPLMWEPRTVFEVPAGSDAATVNPRIREGFLRREQATMTLACQAPNGSAERAELAETYWKLRTLRNPPTAEVALPADQAIRTALYAFAMRRKQANLEISNQPLSETL